MSLLDCKNAEQSGGDPYYFVTGTQAYGPATTNSDLDIVLSQENAFFFKEFCMRSDVEVVDCSERDEYEGFKVHLDFLIINVIVVGDETEYNAWKYATERMKEINPIENKEERVKKFKIFFDKFYNTLN